MQFPQWKTMCVFDSRFILKRKLVKNWINQNSILFNERISFVQKFKLYKCIYNVGIQITFCSFQRTSMASWSIQMIHVRMYIYVYRKNRNLCKRERSESTEKRFCLWNGLNRLEESQKSPLETCGTRNSCWSSISKRVSVSHPFLSFVFISWHFSFGLLSTFQILTLENLIFH